MFPPICGFHLYNPFAFRLAPLCHILYRLRITCTCSINIRKLQAKHVSSWPLWSVPSGPAFDCKGFTAWQRLFIFWASPGPSFLTATNLGKGIDECSRLRSSHRSALIDLSFWPCWTYLNLANQRIIDPYIPLEFIASLHITSIHSSTPVLSLIGSCSVSHGLIRSPQHPHLFSSLYISKWLKWARLARGSSPTASAMALWLR